MNWRISQQQKRGRAPETRFVDVGDYKQFIFPLLFCKRLRDVLMRKRKALAESGADKGYASGKEQHRFQIQGGAHCREVRKAPRNVRAAIQFPMRAIETANPDKLYGIFGDAQWTNKERLSDTLLRELVEDFSSLELAVASSSLAGILNFKE